LVLLDKDTYFYYENEIIPRSPQGIPASFVLKLDQDGQQLWGSGRNGRLLEPHQHDGFWGWKVKSVGLEEFNCCD